MAFFSNLFSILARNREIQPQKPTLYTKVRGAYSPITTQQFYDKVRQFALGLSGLGVQMGDSVAILSGNRPEWAYADFAALSLGALNVPIYPTLSAVEIAYILTDSKAKIVVLETRSHLDSVLSIRAKCVHLTHIVVMTEVMTPEEKQNSDYLSFYTVIEQGAASTDLQVQEWESKAKGIASSQDATIVYTSGTTGNPKGVVLTHHNILTNVKDILEITPLSGQDVVLSFLPLCHVFERTVGYYTLLAVDGTIYYAENMSTVSQNMMEARPTILVSVPRLYEKIQAKLLDDLHGFKKNIFYWSIKIGQKYHSAIKTGYVSFWLSAQRQIADRLVFSKVRAKTGGRLRFFVSGGAPLARELARFFENMGFVILEGYGLTESSPVIACNRLDAYKLGTVGKALPSVEIKLAEDGELLAKGPSMMLGYFHLPEATSEVLDPEGWLHTGDIAEIDSEGFVKIIDRKKELIVLSNGKKVPPQMIEKRLMISPFVSQVVVIGEGRNYLVALIVPNMARLNKFVGRRHLQYHSPEELLALPQVQALYTGITYRKLHHFANFEKVKKFRLLAQEFSPESGELTPTLKPRRKVIYKKFDREIASMYEQNEPETRKENQ